MMLPVNLYPSFTVPSCPAWVAVFRIFPMLILAGNQIRPSGTKHSLATVHLADTGFVSETYGYNST